MDMGYSLQRRGSQPGHSIEISFRALGEDGELDSGFLAFLAELMLLVNASVNTFFGGYM